MLGGLVDGRPNVKARIVAFLVAVSCPVVLFASQRDATLKVLSSYQQTVRGVGVGMGDTGPSTTAPCSQPFPDDAVAVSTTAAGSVSQCTFASPSSSMTGSVQATRVKAILTTSDGSSYFVDLNCQKQFGTCTPLKDAETYPAKMSDDAKHFADYVNRRVVGAVTLSLRPDGKKKVSYTIYFAAKAPPQP